MHPTRIFGRTAAVNPLTGNLGLALLASVAANDLALKRIDDAVKLFALERKLGLNLPETIDRLENLIVAEIWQLGENAICHDPVD